MAKNLPSAQEHLVYRRLLDKAMHTLSQVQYEIDTAMMIKAQLDEVSILFKHPDELEHFIRWARLAGLHHFNSAADRVWRQDCEDERPFDVRFEFFRIPGFEWRIEAMAVLGGQADIHAPLANHAIPHVSFKCLDPMHYDHVCAVLASGNMECQASYTSGYGAFSYFGAFAPYLKPRVNLRDRDGAIV